MKPNFYKIAKALGDDEVAFSRRRHFQSGGAKEEPSLVLVRSIFEALNAAYEAGLSRAVTYARAAAEGNSIAHGIQQLKEEPHLQVQQPCPTCRTSSGSVVVCGDLTCNARLHVT